MLWKGKKYNLIFLLLPFVSFFFLSLWSESRLSFDVAILSSICSEYADDWHSMGRISCFIFLLSFLSFSFFSFFLSVFWFYTCESYFFSFFVFPSSSRFWVSVFLEHLWREMSEACLCMCVSLCLSMCDIN